MKLEAAVTATKAVATGGVSAALFGLTPWGWAAALIGAALSYYFEPEHTPDKALRLAFGIFAMAFAAGLLAVALPGLPWVGPTAAEIPLEARAGLLGLSVRFLWEQGRRLLGAWKRPAAGS